MNKARKQKGSVFVEYALLIGAITLIAILAFSVLGHKANDIVATSAALLPGAHTDDDVSFESGELVAFTHSGGDAAIDVTQIGGANSNRVADAMNLTSGQMGTIVK